MVRQIQPVVRRGGARGGRARGGRARGLGARPPVAPVPQQIQPVAPQMNQDEQRAWRRLRARYAGRGRGRRQRAQNRRFQQLDQQNHLPLFFRFNEHRGARGGMELVPRHRIVHQQVDNMPGVYHKVHSVVNPLQIDKEQAFMERAVQQEPLGEISSNAQSAMLGQYISMKILPAVIYIHIKKGVEQYALQILAKQLIKHARGIPTRILVKQNVHGKFAYNSFLTTKIMSALDDNSLYERLLSKTKDRKRAVTLVIRQKLREGHLHELWNSEHSFL
jgi:hypothetical protein